MPVTWNPEQFIAKVSAKIEAGLVQAGGEVQRLAVTKAPVRKYEASTRTKGRRGAGASMKGERINIYNPATGRYLPNGGIRNVFTTGSLGASLQAEIERQTEGSDTFKAMVYDAKGKPVRLIGSSEARAYGSKKLATKLARENPPPISAAPLARILRKAGLEFRLQNDVHGSMVSREVRAGKFDITELKKTPGKQSQYVPVLRFGGGLRRSIAAEKVKKEGRTMRVVVRANAPYAIYVEFPTRRTKAQPFLLPALEAVKPRVISMMKGGE